jgi:hypothetical protein
MVFFRLLTSYNNALAKRPILVTSLSTGFCYTSGDILAQYIEKKQDKREEYDLTRTTVFGIFGTLFAGPIYYSWFSKINKMPFLLENIVRWNQQRLLTSQFKKQLNESILHRKIDEMSMKTFREQFKHHFDTIEKPIIRSKTVLVSKVYADQFIFSVLYPIFFMITTGIMLDISKNKDKLTFTKLKDSFYKSIQNVREKFVKIYVADCAIWPLIQMANFAFIPAPLQPIFVNCVNIGWNAFLSYVSQESHH